MLPSLEEESEQIQPLSPMEKLQVKNETKPFQQARAERYDSSAETQKIRDIPPIKPKASNSNLPSKSMKYLAVIASLLFVVTAAAWYATSNNVFGARAVQSGQQANQTETSTEMSTENGSTASSTGQTASQPGVTNRIKQIQSQTAAVNTTKETQQIQTLLNKWVSTAREKNINSHVACYADLMEKYFESYNYPKSDLYEDKLSIFTKYNVINMSIDDVKISLINDSEAIATFNKQWDARGSETFAGEEIQELKLRKYNGEWKIFSESELNIFWVTKNGQKIV
jgi:hypothetical protein